MSQKVLTNFVALMRAKREKDSALYPPRALKGRSPLRLLGALRASRVLVRQFSPRHFCLLYCREA